MRALGAYAVWAALAAAAIVIVRAQQRRPAAWQSPALATVAAGSVFAFAIVSWGRATPSAISIKPTTQRARWSSAIPRGCTSAT